MSSGQKIKGSGTSSCSFGESNFSLSSHISGVYAYHISKKHKLTHTGRRNKIERGTRHTRLTATPTSKCFFLLFYRHPCANSRLVVRCSPRWLVPNCISNPSLVACRSGMAITPALFTRMSSRSEEEAYRLAKDPTLSRDARSNAIAPTCKRKGKSGGETATCNLRVAQTAKKKRAHRCAQPEHMLWG